MKLARDTWLIFQRQTQLLLRNPVWVFVGVFQPVMYLLLFAPLLKPALDAPSARPTGHTRSSCPACWCCWPSSAACSRASA